MLSNKEFQRYSRHLILPEIGLEGQLKLRAAKVLLVGAGGLGSPLGLYLAAAGIGGIGLVDHEDVDLTNLQRQVIFGTNDTGRPKCNAARNRLRNLNPEIRITTHRTRLTNRNAIRILSDYDIIVDGSDNFPTRYLINDACVLLGKPNIYGGVFRFEGQASVFFPEDGPCYRCLYPEPPPPDRVPSCTESGVLGVLPGIIGTIQTTETIKLILGIGESLKGRLLLFDAYTMRFREMKLEKNPSCPVCGPNPTITKLIDYETFCGIHPRDQTPAPRAQEIGPLELKQKLDAGEPIFLLDVREEHESEISSIGGLLIPLRELPDRREELDTERDIVIYCRTGVFSALAVDLLKQSGFRKVRHLKGGINAWAEDVDPKLPKY